MAGTMEHIAVALELMKRWDGRGLIERPELFVEGNIIPDSIMSRKHYTRDLKMHTHFRDGIPDYEFSKPENLELYHRRIHDFADRFLRKPRKDRDLYLGYLTHTLTDEYFMLMVRPEFLEKIAVLGLTDRDWETFDHFTFDVDQIDFRLAAEYPGMDRICQMFRHMPPVSVEGMITEEEAQKSDRWLVSTYFERTEERKEPVYYTYQRALRFISEAVEVIDGSVEEYIGKKRKA